MSRLLPLTLAAALTAACATAGWEPVVDPQADAHPKSIDRDLEQCRRLALRASGDVGDQAVRGGAIGAAGGAVVGAMLGSISGDVGPTAAAGAVIGGAGGSASQGLGASDQFRVSYIKCMQGRGHRVIN